MVHISPKNYMDISSYDTKSQENTFACDIGNKIIMIRPFTNYMLTKWNVNAGNLPLCH